MSFDVGLGSFTQALMNETWQIAKERPRRRPKPGPRVYVSINKRGEIAMSAEAFLRIGAPANVTLLYDETHHRIGVKYPIPLDRNFFPARRYGRGRKMRIIRAMRMLKQFGITINQTIIYKNCTTQLLDGHPMLVLNLNEG